LVINLTHHPLAWQLQSLELGGIMPRIRRALISVFDKQGIADFAKVLTKLEIEILSTGGTAKHLNESGIPCTAISEVTGFPEILDGRVKTLHPNIFGGLLARREDTSQMTQLRQHGIPEIDLLVVNLYPFEETIRGDSVSLETALENIDIGGPAMIRAAAKNFVSVAVATSPAQYAGLATELQSTGGELSLDTRRQLAREAFARTSQYDHTIQTYLTKPDSGSAFPRRVQFLLDKVQDLRYGENPHQGGAFYGDGAEPAFGLVNAKQLHGKGLSFNNLLDLDTGLGLAQEFSEPCAVIIKHTNPCGVAVAANLSEAHARARATDPVSAFGGIVALNRTVDEATAGAIGEVFTEVVIAPGFQPAALEILRSKKNLRLLQCADIETGRQRGIDIKKVLGGFLLQDQDFYHLNDIKYEVATRREPSADEWSAMKFGWLVAKWVKSNAIVFCSANAALGIGAGQMSRVDSCQLAIDKARSFKHDLHNSAVASDAFFPFRDGVDLVAEAGATAVIQPGGSVRDSEVIEVANSHNLTMVFTKVRHFRH
jgi:phosphoribosylaminoimidazolecarboxamide formyltransferase/IMP cyclohydrolase